MATANVNANYVLTFGKFGFPALGFTRARCVAVFAWFIGVHFGDCLLSAGAVSKTSDSERLSV
jgi:hypothetical protein